MLIEHPNHETPNKMHGSHIDRRTNGGSAAPAKPFGILIWPLGIAATGFLLAATLAIFIVWMPVITLFGIRGHALQLIGILGVGAPVPHRA
jgi:hypothetical protein